MDYMEKKYWLGEKHPRGEKPNLELRGSLKTEMKLKEIKRMKRNQI